MIFRCTVHPKGLDPFQAAKAWHLRVQQGLPWKVVRSLVRTASNEAPGQDALEDAVARVDKQRRTPLQSCRLQPTVTCIFVAVRDRSMCVCVRVTML